MVNVLVNVSLAQPDPSSPSLHPTVIVLSPFIQSSLVLVVSSSEIIHSGAYVSAYVFSSVLVSPNP